MGNLFLRKPIEAAWPADLPRQKACLFCKMERVIELGKKEREKWLLFFIIKQSWESWASRKMESDAAGGCREL